MNDTTPPTLRDAALARAFATPQAAPLAAGASGTPVVALQYALGRLGHLTALADGSFGPRTTAALRAFQQGHALPVTGVLDDATLRALDAALARDDGGTAASRASDPIVYLTAQGRALPPVNLSPADAATWSLPAVQAAFGRFVGAYWEVLKANRVEADCKTLALFFMDQFRAKVRADLGVTLPLPRSREATLGTSLNWRAVTTRRPQGYLQRVDRLARVRPGFEAVAAIERIDAGHTLLEGVNLVCDGIDANRVGRAATAVFPWDASRDNHGDVRRAEVPVEALEAGMLLFLDHGGGTWDHAITVVDVVREGARVTELRLAVGSFDDMKDADHATAPTGPAEIDLYAEEMTACFDADGRIARSFVSWASEPRYEVAPRYDAHNTLMDLHPGSRIKVARWG